MDEQHVQGRTGRVGREVEVADASTLVTPEQAVAPDVEALAGELVASASRRGLDLTGEGGLLTVLTRQVLEAELTAHLGYDKHERGRGEGNAQDGSTPKTVRTEIGKVTVDVPRDRAGTFEPQIVKKGLASEGARSAGRGVGDGRRDDEARSHGYLTIPGPGGPDPGSWTR